MDIGVTARSLTRDLSSALASSCSCWPTCAQSWLLCTGNWSQASQQRQDIVDFLQNCSGVGTMLDVRRYSDYDANDTVSHYLNLAPVKVSFWAAA